MTEPKVLPPVLLIGASSDIGMQLAREFARAGHPLILTGRETEVLEPLASDLSIRHSVAVQLVAIDVLHVPEARRTIAALTPPPHIAVCLVGLLGDQQQQQRDPDQARIVIESNFTGPAAILEAVADVMAGIDAPTTIVGVSSVAGDRGRARNYYYGAAKAGFSAFLSGLRQRLTRSQTTVITVKPGFVNTRMTAGMDLPPALTASDIACARLIKRAIDRRQLVVYPWQWRVIMTVVKLLPEEIFKRLQF